VQPQRQVTQEGTGPASGTRPEGAGLPRRIHAPRAIGVVLGALCVGAALIQHGTPTWTWLAVAMQVIAWPHLAYWLSSRSPTPREAEYRNLVVDCALSAFWLPAMGFDILPSAATLTVRPVRPSATMSMGDFFRGLRLPSRRKPAPAIIAGSRPSPSAGTAWLPCCLQ